MSETTGAETTDDNTDDTEASARRMGWRPREEFRGNPERWKPAKEFLDTGFGTPEVLAERYKSLDDKYSDLSRTTRLTEQRLGEAVSTIGELTTMMRSSEKRAYERARRELTEERAKAVETGDTAAFNRLDAEMQELQRTAPAPVVERAAPVPGAPPPEVQEFFVRNPWYQQDRELQIEADIVHKGLLGARPDLSMSQNLAEVERRVRDSAVFKSKFRTAPAMTAGAENPRREEAAAVTASSADSPRRTQQRFTFDGMPKDAKDAYARYAAMLAGKGEPLTKEEYSRDYWAQFQDDGR